MIYDAFIFSNELELLEIRLHELNSVVDRFVLVEAARTFTNQPKPLCFQEQRQRFAPFLDKLIHVAVTDTPDTDDPCLVADFQRDALSRGLQACKPEDFIMLSDADEIPTAESVVRAADSLPYRTGAAVALWHRLLRHRAVIWTVRNWFKRNHPFVRLFEQSFHKFYLNCVRQGPGRWYGTRMTRFRDFSRATHLRRWKGKRIQNGGWHFSSMGGVARVQAKLASYSHREFNQPQFTDPKLLAEAMEQGRNLNVPSMKLRFEAVNDSYPAYLRANLARYKDWIREPG